MATSAAARTAELVILLRDPVSALKDGRYGSITCGDGTVALIERKQLASLVEASVFLNALVLFFFVRSISTFREMSVPILVRRELGE